MKILMVCLGNICRSPLAQGIMEAAIKEHGLDWEVDSAGTSSWHVGELPDRRSIEVAKTNGIDIMDQRARQFQVADFQTFDHIMVMDSSNYQDVIQLSGSEAEKEKVELIMNFSSPGQNRAVPDPYWDDNGFLNVFQMLSIACAAFIQEHQK